MNALYITSVERYSGKTATCLALGRRFQQEGHQVGYLKPLSLQPWRVENRVADEDAGFVIQALGLDAKPWELSPVVITPEFLESRLKQADEDSLLETITAACQSAGEGKDLLLLEGGGSLREGYVVGLPTPLVAERLNSKVLAIVKYRDNIRLLDDALAASNRLGSALLGILINRVPGPAWNFVKTLGIPYLERRGIPVFGTLPDVQRLSALTVSEMIAVLEPQVLTGTYDPEALIDHLTVGAMTADAALSRFRKQANKAVITGGDRTDIQLAALETSTTCLVLTGNLQPNPMIVRRAEALGIAVLLVPGNTMETIEGLESVIGKTRLGVPAKLVEFQNLMDEHMDFGRLVEALGI